MADIELVIKLDEEQYEFIKQMTMDKVKDYHALLFNICERIANGTPLPKGLEQEHTLDKIRADIEDWQTDIHDNEYDADKHDFVFEQIFEIIDKYKKKSEEEQ